MEKKYWYLVAGAVIVACVAMAFIIFIEINSGVPGVVYSGVVKSDGQDMLILIHYDKFCDKTILGIPKIGPEEVTSLDITITPDGGETRTVTMQDPLVDEWVRLEGVLSDTSRQRITVIAIFRDGSSRVLADQFLPKS
ncbi:MAG: hypothetical protein APR53_04690 [Methanoculleus sp. SDB]|nr:MAG: hypothetical protein APR53_04690 [Methanoculleus sp. SDB]